MTVGSDIAAYWLTDPEAVTVTYTERDGTTATATAKAKRGELNYREVQLGGPVGVEPTDAVWIVGAVTVSGVDFHQGGTITYAGVGWNILSVTPRLAAGEIEAYRAVCRERT